MSRLVKQVLLGCVFLLAFSAQGMADTLAEAHGAFEAGDYAKAATLYIPLAKQGNAVAQFKLGVIYSQGLVVLQDYPEAIQWYLLSANQGYAPAQVKLGVMYAQGRGVNQDYKKAVLWFQSAADKGDASAQFNLGEMYAQGHGVPQDYKKAINWYRQAADKDDASAQYKLGQLYSDGQGVTPSGETAHMWFNLAAANAADAVTHDKYIKKRDLVANQLSPQKNFNAQQETKVEAELAAKSETESAKVPPVAHSKTSKISAEKSVRGQLEVSRAPRCRPRSCRRRCSAAWSRATGRGCAR